MNERHLEPGNLPAHFYQPASDTRQPTLLLLHGVGGWERDLLPIAARIAPHAGHLGVRGQVLENGLARYFSRDVAGQDGGDSEHKRRTAQLLADLDRLAQSYGFDRDRVLVVGYSDGANMAASMLAAVSHCVAAAILLHPSRAIADAAFAMQQDVPVFISSGVADPAARMMTTALIERLGHAGARITTCWTSGGHQLNREEIDGAYRWYQQELAP